MNVKCCKCFRNTRLFTCPKCGHRVCTSCKEVPRKSRAKKVSAPIELIPYLRLHDIL